MIKFLTRFGFCLLRLLLLCIPLQLIGAVVLLFVLPVVRYRARRYNASVRLPGAFKWFDNYDVWSEGKRDTSTYLQVFRQGFWYNYYWLAVRNPCNYFGYQILGFEVKSSLSLLNQSIEICIPPEIPPKVIIQDVEMVGDSAGHYPGQIYSEYLVDGKIRYEYYLIFQWSKSKCFRFRMGYKCGHLGFLPKPIEAVFVIQPFKDYTGINSL